jgi:hypothetical protein
MGTDAKKKDSRTHGIDNRHKRYERNAHPRQKISHALHGTRLS